MSSDHRKPVVAFVALVFIAAALVGIDRADAQGGRLLAAVIGTSVRVQGDLIANAAASPGGTADATGLRLPSGMAFDARIPAEVDGDDEPGAKKAVKKTSKEEAKAERLAAKAERFAAKAERMAAKARWLSGRGRPPWAAQASEHGRSQASPCSGKSTQRHGRGHKRGRGFSHRR